jgi:type VII secretion-associated protein (TIGR03931 family)
VLSITTMTFGATETVLIDAPAAVRGAGTLAVAIAKRLTSTDGVTVVLVDDIRLRTLAGELKPSDEKPYGSNRDRTTRTIRYAPTLVALAAFGLICGEALHRYPAPRTTDRSPTALIVEGHVALEVPARWPKRRITAGPGSARVQITSPTDPEVALHVTQSQVALTGLAATAEFLKSAIDAAPVGVFVDFNPSDRGAGHPVVTYREVRAGHDVRWTVWVDKAVRISIGCQSRSGRYDAVARECELAVRSARALE